MSAIDGSNVIKNAWDQNLATVATTKLTTATFDYIQV